MRPLIANRLRFLCLLASALATAMVARQSDAASLLLVTTQNGSLLSEEAARKAQFEAWGHSVATIWSGATQATFDAAVANHNLAYVPEDVLSTDLASKLREALIGVVYEEMASDDFFGMASVDGYVQTVNFITISAVAHPVTAGLPSGDVVITTSNQPLIVAQGSLAPGSHSLGTIDSDPSLLTVETGGTLANSYNGSSVAIGRRVRLPWGGNAFQFSSLNANGLLILQNAINWAAAGYTPEPTEPLVHWKLDETGGTIVNYGSLGSAANATSGGTVSYGQPGLLIDGGSSMAFANGWVTPGDVGGLNTNPGAPWTQRTIEVWFQADHTTGRQVIYEQGGGTRDLLIYLDGTSLYILANNRANDDGTGNAAPWGNPPVYLVAPQAIQPGVRYHVAAVLDANTTDLSGHLRGYVNGASIGSISGVGPLWGHNPVILGMTREGNRYHDNTSLSQGNPFSGRIDDVKIWDGVLSADTLLAHYAAGWGLLAHWKLDESSGTSALDSSGSGNDALLSGTEAWVSGQDAGAHDFHYLDGDDYFTSPTSDPLDQVNEGDYTLMAYFRPDSVPPGSGSANDAQYAIVIREGWHVGLNYNSNQQFQMDHVLAGSTWTGAGTWSKTYPPGRYYHVAAVVDRDAGTVKLYVDGQLIDTGTFAPGTAGLNLGSNAWRLGIASPGATSWRWSADGVIDDARIYNRALSDAEIAALAGSDLVGHWQLDELAGATAADQSTYANTGTYQGGGAALLGDGSPFPAARAAWFDDEGAYVQVPHASSLVLTDNLTLTAWVQRLNDSDPTSDIIAKRAVGGDAEYRMQVDSNGNLRLIVNEGSPGAGNGPWQEASNIRINDQKWHHVAVTYDRTTVRWYIDGQLDRSVAASFTIGTAGFDLSIGGLADAWLNGSIYDARIYRRALDGGEISELYGLVGHWKLNESSGTAASDSSLVGNHASYLGGVALASNEAYPSAGLAPSFDGLSGRVEIGSMQHEYQRGFAVALWARPTEVAYYRRFIDFGSGAGVDNILLARENVSNNLILEHYNGSLGAGPRRITAASAIELNRWQHFVASVDGNGVATLYKNGQPLATATIGVPNSNSRSGCYIGRSHWGADPDFKGNLADVRIYSRPLRSEEVAQLYGLVGWYRMEAVSGTFVADSSGANNVGVIAGTPSWTSDAKEGSGALQLNGSSYVQINQLAPQGSSASLAGWVKLVEADNNGAELVSLGDEFAIRLDAPAGGTTVFAYAPPGWNYANTDRFYEGTGWHHFAAVANRNAMQLEVYIDGILRSSQPLTTVQNFGNIVAHTRIGANASNSPDYDLDGSVDDIRVFNRPISREEVRAHYFGGYVPGVRIIEWVEVR